MRNSSAFSNPALGVGSPVVRHSVSSNEILFLDLGCTCISTSSSMSSMELVSDPMMTGSLCDFAHISYAFIIFSLLPAPLLCMYICTTHIPFPQLSVLSVSMRIHRTRPCVSLPPVKLYLTSVTTIPSFTAIAPPCDACPLPSNPTSRRYPIAV